MRQSRYNITELTDNGEYLLYNTATGAFAVLDADAQQCYESCSGTMAADLENAGFITPLTAEEELAAYRQRLVENRADHSAFTLSFVPTYACNFRCPYCYEHDRVKLGGMMDERVRNAIMNFIAVHYDQEAFSKLSVQWYGGDPSLALSTVDALSQQLIEWCDSRGITYDALMLTNANTIDEEEADIIARCRVSMVLLTIDGPEDIHNQRRVTTNGTNSYQRTIHAARLLRARGITLNASMNVDRISWPYFVQTRDKLLSEEGIHLNAGRLCDYGHTYGSPPFAPPLFDLFSHEEFCHERYRLFESEPHTADELRSLLQPIRQFCSGQSGDYFVIDFRGDVYSCDGWIGYKNNVRFNVLDDPSTWKPSEIVFDAPLDEKCSQCTLLPLCLGSCIWERETTGMPCHPLKDEFGGYLRIYRSCFDDCPNSFTLLAEPVEDALVYNDSAIS